jgi:RNase P protein component
MMLLLSQSKKNIKKVMNLIVRNMIKRTVIKVCKDNKENFPAVK